MFAMFSLRRPDILAVGDLGLQKGLLRWVLASHSSNIELKIHPEKLAAESKPTSTAIDADDASVLPPVPTQIQGDVTGSSSAAPVSTVSAVLNKNVAPIPLPEGLTVAALKSRLEGKKIKYAPPLRLHLPHLTTITEGGCISAPKRWKILLLSGGLTGLWVAITCGEWLKKIQIQSQSRSQSQRREPIVHRR